MTKRKDERRELLKEDELLSGMEKVAHYIQANPKRVLIWTLVSLGVLALFFGSQFLARSNKIEAAADLYRAEKILNTDLSDEKSELKFGSQKEQYEAALKEVDRVISSQSGLIKQQAVMLKVRCLTSLGRSDELVGLYEEMAAKGGKLAVFGVKGLADYYFVKKDYARAMGEYEKLKGMGSVSDALVTYRLAVCHKENGDKAKAREMLNSLVDQYKDAEAEERPPIHFKAEQMLTEMKEGDSSEG